MHDLEDNTNSPAAMNKVLCYGKLCYVIKLDIAETGKHRDCKKQTGNVATELLILGAVQGTRRQETIKGRQEARGQLSPFYTSSCRSASA